MSSEPLFRLRMRACVSVPVVKLFGGTAAVM